jgi:CheY-like chemotaxis protein
MARILVIDDDEGILTTIGELLRSEGHIVETASDGVEAARLFRAAPFQLILTDIVMPNRDGLETVIELHAKHPNVGIIAMSGGVALSSFVARSKTYLELATKLGAHYTLAKPFTRQQLNDAVTDTLAAMSGS